MCREQGIQWFRSILVFKIYHFLCNKHVTVDLQPIKNSTQPAIFAWKPAAWVHATGEDVANFLQGQFTNELRGLGVGGAVYGLWLNVKGKVLADSFVVCGGDQEFWIGSYFSPAGVILERLESYVIADDVVFEDQTTAWSGFTLFGAAPSAEVRAIVAAAGFIFRGRRGGEAWEVVVPSGGVAALRAHIGTIAEISDDEVTRRRIAAAIPAVPVDIGPDNLPNEGGLESEAISYTKGCYLGQEVMARLKSMGQVRRRLLRVQATSEENPALPAGLFIGERQVGELRSFVRDESGGGLGLALLSLLHVKPESELALAPGAAPRFKLLDAP
jgi:folate-binding protein YgfZ